MTGRINSRRLYSGKVISVDLDSVRFPNGTVGDLEMVRHSGASAVVPFLDPLDSPDPRIVLVRQYRYATGGYVHEVPAGRLEPGENPKDCARRELREETGYSAQDLIPLTTFYTTPGFTDERIHLFAATGLSEGDSETESDEVLDLAPVTLSQAMAMIASGELIDGKSMIGVLFAERFLRRG